jgi:hypothetical protein
MSVTTMKIQNEVRNSLARVVTEDSHGVSPSDACTRLVADHEGARLRREISTAYARLRGEASGWAAYMAELDEWDSVAAGTGEDA